MKSKKKRGKRHGFLGFERNMLVFQLAENTHKQRVSTSTKKVEKIVKVCLHSSQSLQVYCLASISQFCFDIKFQNSKTCWDTLYVRYFLHSVEGFWLRISQEALS